MKNLIVLTVLILTAQSVSASVVCEKKRGRWYPKNELSKKIALSLGVKTCSGGRFKDVVAALGESSNVKAAKKRNSVADTVKMLKLK